MSVKTAPYYWVECDGCGEACPHGGGEYTAMDDRGDAIEDALSYDWTTDGQRHHCTECPDLAVCERCDGPAGDGPGDRDNHCQQCWDELCADAEEDVRAMP